MNLQNVRVLWRVIFLVFYERLLVSMPQFFRFLSVGAVGFCVDGGVLISLMQSGWEILPARTVSFLLAVTTTWAVNRAWTFKVAHGVGVRKEYSAYILVQIIGAMINIFVFFSLIKLHPPLRGIPLLPLAVGAVFSLVFNYLASRKYVYKG